MDRRSIGKELERLARDLQESGRRSRRLAIATRLGRTCEYGPSVNRRQVRRIPRIWVQIMLQVRPATAGETYSQSTLRRGFSLLVPENAPKIHTVQLRNG